MEKLAEMAAEKAVEKPGTRAANITAEETIKLVMDRMEERMHAITAEVARKAIAGSTSPSNGTSTPPRRVPGLGLHRVLPTGARLWCSRK